ncbi:Glycosyl hydrolases family 43 [Geosmithia morbida]|uniref:Glycosyl hydrolases family 43 n=1 Tax=Geosmithia morbida TaxID=1094350 RepID=A0A9P4YQ44_9HYPO|nr:Glycosyl hydrolases family 43 [Geosmithia morbida]KAF4119668.1 Glycosyl hydrolases family 43 [Geosmithia morbida]
MSNQPIAQIATPDPWLVAANGVFYLTFTLANRISIWQSPKMEDFHQPRKQIIWQPPEGAPWSKDIWAPELHWLDGRWYIYATATRPGLGNSGHRTIVLRSSNADPMVASAWEFLGPVKGLPEQFSIDATVFSINGRDLYICWSGWPPGDNSDTQQNLYLTKMVSPIEAVDHKHLKPACISKADRPWERFENNRRGINEGPTWLSLPNGAFTGIVYSGHASFTSEYKLGLLRLNSLQADPMDPKSWTKRPTPLLANDRSMPGPYAPGHASFLQSPQPGDSRVFCIYHGTDNWGEGFKNRKARIMVMSPEVFAHDARPMCCSNRPNTGIWNGYPGSSSSGGGPAPQAQQGNRHSDPMQKIMGKLKKFL